MPRLIIFAIAASLGAGFRFQDGVIRVELRLRHHFGSADAPCNSAYVQFDKVVALCARNSLTITDSKTETKVVSIDTTAVPRASFVGPWQGDSIYIANASSSAAILSAEGRLGRKVSYHFPSSLGIGDMILNGFENGGRLYIDRDFGRDNRAVLNALGRNGELSDTATVYFVGTTSTRRIGRWPSAGDHRINLGGNIAVLKPDWVRHRIQAIGPDRIALAFTDQYNIIVMNSSGAEVGRIVMPSRRVRVSRADRRKLAGC